jgi:hypothetical protein
MTFKDNYLSFTIKDSKSEMEIKITDKEFFIDGSLIGASSDFCYVPVFMSGLG